MIARADDDGAETPGDRSEDDRSSPGSRTSLRPAQPFSDDRLYARIEETVWRGRAAAFEPVDASSAAEYVTRQPGPDEIRAKMRELAALIPAGPRPAYVEVGEGVLYALRAACIPPRGPIPEWRPADAFRMPGDIAALLFGLPIVEIGWLVELGRQDEPLGAGEWRIVASDGAVLTAGRIGLPD